MHTYTWTIVALDCKINENNLQDVVYNVNWRYTASNEDGVSAVNFGALLVPPPSQEDFTPYEDLTKDQVVGWLDAGLNVPAMTADLDNQINLIVNPVDITLPPPFEN
jgi:hypothetical protein